MSKKRIVWFVIGWLLLSVVAVACQPQTVEVTRVVTETTEVEVPVEVEAGLFSWFLMQSG